MNENRDFRFEHLALNVADRAAAERWYVENLGLIVVRSVPTAMSFLADRSGRVVFELYENRGRPLMDFHGTDPLTFHVAFVVDDVEAAARRLVDAGAKVAEPLKEVAGDRLIMLRDPFGMGLQLVNRRSPMF